MRILLPLLLLAVGCRAPDPAPEELSGLLQFAWSHYDLEEPTNDVSLADAGVNFATWFDEEVIATPAIVGGSLYVRTAEQLICLRTPGRRMP